MLHLFNKTDQARYQMKHPKLKADLRSNEECF